MIRVAEWNRTWFPTPWWRRLLAIPGYAAGWIGDHFINVLVLLFAVLLMANLTPPL